MTKNNVRFKKMDTIIDPFPIWDTVEEKGYNCTDTLDLLVNLLNEQQAIISALKEENEQLRLELETHKHSLWNIREAERKVSKLSDSLADEIKKNGVLNEELNQLRIKNMRLKKAEKINMGYAEQIVEENQKLRIAKNDLRIENEQLKQKLEILGLNEKNDAVKMIEGRFFIRM